MAAVTVDASRAADPGLRGPVPARTTGPADADQSLATARPGRAVQSWPLLVLAAPAAAEVWAGWTGIARMTGFGMVARSRASGPRCIWTPLSPSGRRRGVRGIRAGAWLARDQQISARTHRFAEWSAICSFALGMAGQVAYHLMAQAGMTGHRGRSRPSCPACRSWSWAWGPLAHMLRADAEAVGMPEQPDRHHQDPAIPARIRRGPGGTRPQAAWRRPGPVRLAGPGRSRPRTAASRWGQGIRSQARTATDGPGPRGWQEACCVGEASITACVAQCRSQGLQRSPERASAHDQRRTCRSRPKRAKQPMMTRARRSAHESGGRALTRDVASCAGTPSFS